MRLLNVFRILGLFLLLGLLGACHHEESYTHHPYNPISQNDSDLPLPSTPDAIAPSGVVSTEPSSDHDIRLATLNIDEQKTESKDHWSKIIGQYSTRSGEEQSTILIDNTYQLTAELFVIAKESTEVLVPEFPDPLFYDGESKTFYTRGTAVLQDGSIVEVEIYLQHSDDFNSVTVKTITIPEIKTVDIELYRNIAN